MGRKGKVKKLEKNTLNSCPANQCRALVWVDGRNIRKKIRKDYEKTLGEHKRSQRILDQFLQADQPRYERWRSSHFGALLTEIRELAAKLQAEATIVDWVHREAFLSGISEARAYKNLMETQNHFKSPPKTSDDEGDDDRQDPLNADSGPEDEFDWQDPLRSLFEQLFGFADSEEKSQGTRDFPFTPLPALEQVKQASSRVKELYRAVVRRLHPDKQREMTAQKIELWHQAQAANQEGDGEQLEVILAICEIDETGATEQTSASLLQRITDQMKSSLRQIKRQVSKHKRDPAWNFSGRTDLEAFALQIQSELTAESIELKRRWMDIHATVERWKAASQKVQQTRRRKVRPSEPEFQF